MAGNCSYLLDLPTSDEYWQDLQIGYLIAIVIAGCLMISTLGLYVEELHFFFTHLNDWKPKDKAIWLLGIYPVFTTTSFIALVVPRSATLNGLVASLYLSICVYLFVTMLIGHYGGARKMVVRLAKFDIKLQVPPLCCCCFCLPRLRMSAKRLQILETMVFQYALVTPIVAFVTAVMYTDGRYTAEESQPDRFCLDCIQADFLSKSAAYTWLNLVNIVSTITAIYGFILIFRVSEVPLQKICIKPKFICLQLVIVLSNFQHVVVSLLVFFGVVPCDPPLNAKGNGDRWHHMILVVEMFIISLFARNFYRRHVGDMPPEERLVIDTGNVGTMTSYTLGGSQGTYGTMESPTFRYANGVVKTNVDEFSSSDDNNGIACDKTVIQKGSAHQVVEIDKDSVDMDVDDSEEGDETLANHTSVDVNVLESLPKIITSSSEEFTQVDQPDNTGIPNQGEKNSDHNEIDLAQSETKDSPNIHGHCELESDITQQTTDENADLSVITLEDTDNVALGKASET